MAGGPLGNVIRFLHRAVGLPEAGAASDRQLLAQFAQARDEAAFGTLMDRHGPMVWAACRRVLGGGPDAEDAFQATFVVLAQKAGAAGWQESISSWLHAVAYRIALRASRDLARRRRHEEEMANMRSTTAATDHGELRAVLDEELTRLPEKFRAPLVLCYLQGKTNDEAALALGWPKGTVASRLARARDLLRGRLLRRGLALPAAALAATLDEAAASAAVPPTLAQSTMKIAALLPAAQLLAVEGIPLSVASMAQGVLRTMYLAKVKMFLGVAVTLALFGTGTGMVAYRVLRANPVDTPDRPAGARLPPEPERPRASKPLVKDGLSVVTLTTKAAYGKNEEPAVEFVFTNVSKKPFELFGMSNFPDLQDPRGELQELRSGRSWQGKYQSRPHEGPSPAPVPLRLDPGQSDKTAMGLFRASWGDWEWRPDDKGTALRQLPPGKYRATFSLSFRGDIEAFWTGNVTTNPVEFEVLDMDAGTSTLHNGLSVRVIMNKNFYERGEVPKVAVFFQNTTEKPMTLPGQAPSDWTCRFVDLNRRITWRARHPAHINALSARTLAARESCDLNAEFYEAEYQDANVNGAPWVKELPPGRYQVTIGIQSAAAGENTWKGALKTSPVEFEITAR